jgi:hypothetical protein
MLEGHSGIPPFNHIETAFNWIDQQKRSAELQSIEGTRLLYREYTDHLRHRLRLSSVGEASGSIGYSSASNLQRGMAHICTLACLRDLSVVENWAIRISQKAPGANELPTPATTAAEHELAYALHQRFFNAFSQAVLSNATPPILVKLTDLGFEDLIYYNQNANNAGGWSSKKSGGRTDWQPFFYRQEGVFEGSYKAFNALLSEHSIESINSSGFTKKQDKNRRYSQKTLRKLANYATRYFGYLLLAEAGNNATHLSNINCQQVRLNKALGLASTRAIKGRSGFEEQDQHVDLRFAQTTWKSYIKLREWMARWLEEPPELGLFLLGNNANHAPYTLLTASSMRQIPLWPKRAPVPAIRPARKHKTVNLVEGSGGNTALVAGIQAVTTQTIERHYNFKNRVEAAEEMSHYFAAQAKAAELRYKGVQAVRIIEDGNSIHTGFCDDDTDGPRLLEGFDEITIVPRCGAPITCMFCAHFGLHADVGDLLRLLTINCWIEVQSRLCSVNIDEYYQKFAPYLNRIQQILEDLSALSGEIYEHLREAQRRFQCGERDLYWNAKINALLEMDDT